MTKYDVRIVDVPVATLWTTEYSAREIDAGAIDNPCDIKSWIASLDYEKGLELCTENLVQSQVLYGQEVYVLEEKGDWTYVALPNQATRKNQLGYPGWIPKKQLVKREGYSLQSEPIAIVEASAAELCDGNKNAILSLSFQTRLPLKKQEGEWVQVSTPSGEGWIRAADVVVYPSFQDVRKGTGKDIVKQGERFLKLDYLWGGMSSFGYDCSGFSYSMCLANGYVIPRDASEQAEAGKNIPLEEMEPGDLLFFAYEEGKGHIHHVGIYYGENKLLHSPKTGKTIEIIPLENTIYEKELCVARRYWE